MLHWLVEAAEQLTAFSAYFLCELHVKQLQLDELYVVLRDLKAGEINEAGAIQRLERSPYWVWTAMDPNSKRTTARPSCPILASGCNRPGVETKVRCLNRAGSPSLSCSTRKW